MKKLTTLSINSLPHSYTSIFEVEKGEGFHSEIPNIKGAERLYELTLKKGKIIYTAIDSMQDFVDRLDAHFKNLEDKRKEKIK